VEILLDKRVVRQIRLSAQDAIEEGDTETLREDILEAFTEEQVEEIERRLDNGDFFEFVTDMLDEWSGDDVDELFELMDTQLGDVGIEVKFEKATAPAASVDERTEADEEEEETTAEYEDDDEDEDEDKEELEEEDDEDEP
jgi:Mg/Co/Ni transporter MgtE